MKKTLLMVMIIAIGILFYSCGGPEKGDHKMKHKCAATGTELPEGKGIKKMLGEEELWFGNKEVMFDYLLMKNWTWSGDKIMPMEEGKHYCAYCASEIPEGMGMMKMKGEEKLYFANDDMLNMYLTKHNMKVDGDMIVPAE